MRLVFENVTRLELDVDDGARVQVVCYESPNDGMIGRSAPSEIAAPGAFVEAGRHGWHVRRGMSEPGCARCAEGGGSSPLEPRLQPPSEGVRLDLDLSDQSDLGRGLERGSGGEVADAGLSPTERLDRRAAVHPDAAALKAKRWKGLHPDQALLLDRIANDPRVAPDADAGRAWSAQVIRDAPRRTKLMEHLEAAYREMCKPPPPPPVDPDEQRARAERRREEVMSSFRDLVERGEASDVVRSIYERMTQQH